MWVVALESFKRWLEKLLDYILTKANEYWLNKAGDGIKVASKWKSNKNALKASAFNCESARRLMLLHSF